MENKKQDVKSLEELSKAADEFRKWAIDFGDRLAKVLADIQTSKKEEDTWEMKCPYKDGDDYYFVRANGLAKYDSWDGYVFENEMFDQGNVFPNKESAELEAKRRNLLTRFRSFRDECNGEWKADWNTNDAKWSISKNEDGLSDVCTISLDIFATFGYFKNQEDCKRAIELFGDEIKRLYVEVE